MLFPFVLLAGGGCSCSDGKDTAALDSGLDGGPLEDGGADAGGDSDTGKGDASFPPDSGVDSGSDAADPFEKKEIELFYHRLETAVTTLWADDDGLFVGTGRWGLLRVDAQGTLLEEYNRFSHALPSDSVLSFFAEPDGTLWIGTRAGVAVVQDGSFEILDQDDGFLPGFVDGENDISEIRADAQGHIWVYATGAGFGRFDGESWTTFDVEDGVPEGAWGGFAIDAVGGLWGSALSGAYHFDGSAWNLYTSADGLVTPPIWDVEVDSLDRKWFSSWEGISVLEGGIFETIVPASYCTKLYVDTRDRVFVAVLTDEGEENGLVALPSGEHAGPGGPSRIDAVTEDTDGVLWFGQEQSLYRYDESGWSRRSIPYLANAPVGTRVNGLDFDAQGNLWLATNGGVSRFDGTTWTNHTEENGLPFNDVVDIHAIGEELVWAATSVAGVANWDGESWTAYRRTNSDILSSKTNALTTDPNGVLWVATDAGVSAFDGQVWTNHSYGDGLPVDFATGILVNYNGDVWIRRKPPIPEMPGLGVSRYDGESWRSFTADDGLPSDTVTSMVPGGDGRVWMCTTAGVAVFDGEQWQAPDFTGDVPSRAFNTMAIDEDGILWFSESNAVFKYNGEELIKYGSEDGLRDTGVGSIVSRSFGELWFSTRRGVGRLVEKTGESWKVKW